MKTDLSLPDSLYNQVSILANEMQIPEKQLLILAIEDYLRRHHQQELLKSINEAYADKLDPSEQVMLEGIRQHHRHLAEAEW
ncbi:hypothetical protein Q5689_25960 [Microcoleus sp. ARI1-A2]